MSKRRSEEVSAQQRSGPRTEGGRHRSGALSVPPGWMLAVVLLIVLVVLVAVNPGAIEQIWTGPMRLPGL